MFNQNKIGSLSSGWFSPEYGGGGFGFGNNQPIPAYIQQEYNQPMVTLPYSDVSPLTEVLQTIRNQTLPASQNNAPVECNCLHGTPFIRPDGSCGCVSTVTNPNIDAPEPQPNKPVYSTTPVVTTPVVTTPVVTAPVDIVEKMKANIVPIIGIAAVAFLLLKKK